MINFFIATLIKIFFLLTPFFVLSMYLLKTRAFDVSKKHSIALKTGTAIMITTLTLFFFGNYVFEVLGITLPAFQIGAGALLFLSAVAAVYGTDQPDTTDTQDIAVVPLTLPVTVGPGTTGTLLVMGAQITDTTEKLIASIAVASASLLVGFLLYTGVTIEKILGPKGLNILSKLTGLVLAALSAQMIFTGIRSFLT
ncbi:MAG: hypothetical protein A2Y07_01365 [Planctomycetes bacterium GWF2_50_10]|nr:MAG: hypothetical protein A2Y07_01365 [Planctomycetes bacterium GWF2_50_10]